MQIRTHQYLAVILTAVAISAIALTLFVSLQRMNVRISESHFASVALSDSINALQYVTVDYVLNPTERAKIQWRQEYSSLSKLLANHSFEGMEEKHIVGDLVARLPLFEEMFSTLVDVAQVSLRSAQEEALAIEVSNRRVLQIMAAAQEMRNDENRLVRLNQQQMAAAHRWTTVLTALLVAMVGLIIAANFTVTVLHILRPVTKLKRAAESLGNGDLGARVGLKLDNELGVLSAAFDQMAAKLAEAQVALERRTAQLEQANSELNSFSYSVAHDLRAPLRGIDGWSLALLEDYGSQMEGKAREYLERVREETQRMGRLIDDLLQLARVTRGEMNSELVDVTALALRIHSRLRQAYPERQAEVSVQPGLTAKGDVSLLEIALTNLLDNAFKFTRLQPVARIEVGRVNETAKRVSDKNPVYFVRDNGVGFDMAAHGQRLFGAFQRMHKMSEFPGTGIGLATVQRIVHRHGGRVWAEAQPNLGCCIFFTLQADEPNHGACIRR